MGKVDAQLFDKIKEYRKSVQEISDEKLSLLSQNEDMERLLEEASNIANDIAPSRDINQLISDIDSKIQKFLKKHSEYKIQELEKKREDMIIEVEKEIENRINQDLEITKKEAEQYIDDTIQYYKKKLESDNQVLSTANNIIKRREQILDEAYEKSLKIVEEAEEKARQIIESSSYAQDEAAAIIAEYEQKGEEIKNEAELEAERIISDANVESARIIQAAEDQHQDIVEAATQDGFNVGYQEGKEEAVKENSELLKEALNALNKLYAALPVAVYQNEEKIIKLSYQVSESVLSETVTRRDEAAKKFILKSLKNISDLGIVKVNVNPQDLDSVLPKQDYFKALLPDIPEFLISSNNNINKGNCSISTDSEKYNISINTQLSILDALFQEVLENSD
jgi:flagellar assembly protein FliH